MARYENDKYDWEKGRQFEPVEYQPRMGRSSVMIPCPFCDAWFEAFVWSLAGSGKKCPGCGALHCSTDRMAYPERKPEISR